ncbi:MAG TPA: YciI family protein [Candidatus Competibacter sp.]|nr:hypothetical protein [Candidatus Competibacteraceae bacterium]HRC73888.1 YciI family protein [Candidatus Competibacter sp.]
MRFMILVKATPASEAGLLPPERLSTAMAAYREGLVKAGVLLDASGLYPTSKGWRIRYAGAKRTVIEGPFAETKGLVAGYTLLQVKSEAEAMEWARRFPNPAGDDRDGEIEVRRLAELDEFDPGETTEWFRAMESGAGR